MKTMTTMMTTSTTPPTTTPTINPVLLSDSADSFVKVCPEK